MRTLLGLVVLTCTPALGCAEDAAPRAGLDASADAAADALAERAVDASAVVDHVAAGPEDIGR